jgi:hypothetical protein
MEEESSGLPLFPIVVALLVVLVAGGFYIVQLRADNTDLRAELASARQQQPTSAPVQAAAPAPVAAPQSAPAQAPPATASQALTSEQRSALVGELRNELGPVRDVWFAHSPNDAESLAYQRSIQSAFEEAGWTVRHSAPSTFTLRSGIFFLMADESPPPHVLTALEAFSIAGIEVNAGRDYRSFYASKKAENPNWRGFNMVPEQAYIIAVGAVPAE